MFSFLSKNLQKQGLNCFAPLPLEACRIVRPYLLERENITDGTAIMLAVPYYTPACDDEKRNISSYAVSRDYHNFFSSLFEELIPLLKKAYPMYRFAGFADHSPIAEIEAAARAGLGVIGKNHMLLTPLYSSYVFIGEIITDAVIPCKTQGISYCENCGACMRACPAKDCGTCLSALTQKKGILTSAEEEKIIKYGSAWGCDICQEVCPHTKKAIQNKTIYSPIPYFDTETTSHLTSEILDSMSEEEFGHRAYAWRGKETIRRNLLLIEKHKEKKGYPSC